MKKSLSLAAMLLFIPAAIFAQDTRDSGRRLMPAPNAHSGSSPFEPPKEGDTLFVVDTGSGLDTGCTFRDGGPLRIRLLVKRYAGPINGDGTLSDAAGMVSKGYISAKAQLFLPALDIDVNGAPGFPPEVDRVFFNDHDLGTLTGDNGIWKLNSFQIPIEWVKFPAKGSPGSPPAPAENIIKINIDEASVPDFNWCMSVDWSQIEFKAIAPILLVHGTNAQSDSWDPNFTAFFGNSGAPWSNDINLEANGSILHNGGLLATRARELAQSFGAKKCHIVAHSKGGLDSRAFLNNDYSPDELKVLSVYTLSSPHHGTIVSDIIVTKRATENPESTNADIQYLISHDANFWNLTPQPPAIENQTTGAMANFNATYPGVPGEVRFYNYGADADLNHNGTIQAAETRPLLGGFVPDFVAGPAGTAMYRAIGNVAAISFTTLRRPGRLWGTNEYTAIEVAAANTTFQVNDLVTSVSSARSTGGIFLGQLNANHSSMKSQALAGTILQRIVSDFPNH